MSRRGRLLEMAQAKPVILPSMLLCDFSNLQREVEALEQAGALGFHLDVMDGMFVPNMTYGLPIVEAFRKTTDKVLDVHLMIERPENYVEKFYQAGADSITFHIEATDDPEPILQKLKSLEVGVGLAVNPKTPVSRIQPYLPLCDLALIMSVEAGFGGQAFETSALEKLRQVDSLNLDHLLLQVDGGIKSETITECARHGASLFVVGSAIFGNDDYQSSIEDLHAAASA